jgi:carotenoid cleavage dioxygenase-like enzyme
MDNSTENTRPFHLTGAFAPLREERTEVDLEVMGELPRDLCGTYLRNGPNPRSGRSPAWFAGDGMLHGVRLDAGRASWYRNRWIDGAYAPNTNVIRHAGRILALVETRLPIEVDAALETVGAYDFGGALATSMTAHPRLCPQSGELLFFSYGAERPHLTYYRADATGLIIHRAAIQVPAMTYMHDFAITACYVVFYDLPVLVGDWKSPAPLRWSDSYRARFGVVPRAGGNDDVRWFDVRPCTISHIVNAFEDGDSIVLDAICAPRLMTAHELRRFTLDLRTGRTTEAILDPRFVDFPRLHPAFVGLPYRYAYTTELSDFASGGFARTVSHQQDVEARSATVHAFGEDKMPGECLVAPRPGAAGGGDAWVGLVGHDRRGGG